MLGFFSPRVVVTRGLFQLSHGWNVPSHERSSSLLAVCRSSLQFSSQGCLDMDTFSSPASTMLLMVTEIQRCNLGSRAVLQHDYLRSDILFDSSFSLVLNLYTIYFTRGITSTLFCWLCCTQNNVALLFFIFFFSSLDLWSCNPAYLLGNLFEAIQLIYLPNNSEQSEFSRPFCKKTIQKETLVEGFVSVFFFMPVEFEEFDMVFMLCRNGWVTSL